MAPQALFSFRHKLCRAVFRADAARLSLNLFEALNKLHSDVGVVHCDLSCGNVAVCLKNANCPLGHKDCELIIVLLDLAMNTLPGDLCRGQETPTATPPEGMILHGLVHQRGDPQGDVWAAGVIVFRALFYCYPFVSLDGKNPWRGTDRLCLVINGLGEKNIEVLNERVNPMAVTPAYDTANAPLGNKEANDRVTKRVKDAIKEARTIQENGFQAQIEAAQCSQENKLFGHVVNNATLQYHGNRATTEEVIRRIKVHMDFFPVQMHSFNSYQAVNQILSPILHQQGHK